MNTVAKTRLKVVRVGVCLGLIVAISALAADLNVPKEYPTIQAAVDAAGHGDTIHVAPGVYAGQVLISNKSLTLTGSPGAVLRAISGMSQPYLALGSSQVPLLGILRSEVVVSNLAFEGEHLADTQPSGFPGIYYIGSSGRVEDCRISGFRGSTLGSGFANGLRFVNQAKLGTSAVTIQILRNTFADNFVSLTLIGDAPLDTPPTFDPALLRTTFVVSDNIITGNGPDATGQQIGVAIEAGATGEVSRNAISDHAYIGTQPGVLAYGILAYDDWDFPDAPLQPLKPIRFEGNVLRNNQLHLVLVRGDGSAIVNNTFAGTAPGLRPTGLALSGENVLVATNRFSNMPLGILLFGDDPDYGTYLGIAHHAQLTANRFCDVTKQVTVEPSATDTVEGTLVCPFPPPTLAITPAVLLSWPGEDDGWTVESAAALDGPWSPVTATPFMQGGQHSVAVPTDAERRFFRLP